MSDEPEVFVERVEAFLNDLVTISNKHKLVVLFPIENLMKFKDDGDYISYYARNEDNLCFPVLGPNLDKLVGD